MDDLGLGGSISGGGWKFFSFPPSPDLLCDPSRPLSNEYRVLLSGVKRPGREDDLSPPSSSEFKNAWRYTSTPVCLHGAVFS
jgi:hypothetical protein